MCIIVIIIYHSLVCWYHLANTHTHTDNRISGKPGDWDVEQIAVISISAAAVSQSNWSLCTSSNTVQLNTTRMCSLQAYCFVAEKMRPCWRNMRATDGSLRKWLSISSYVCGAGVPSHPDTAHLLGVQFAPTTTNALLLMQQSLVAFRRWRMSDKWISWPNRSCAHCLYIAAYTLLAYCALSVAP